MKREVYRTFPIGNGRVGIQKMGSFLWFEWWNTLPDIYVEYDILNVEEKNLRLQLTDVTKGKKQALDHVKSQIDSANRSYQEFSRRMSFKKRKKSRVDTTMFAPVFEHEDDTTKTRPKRGPPTQIACGPADLPSNNGNQKGNKQQQNNNNQRNNNH